MVMESPTIAKTFEAASNWLSGAPAAATLPNETKLELYGLFKYITTDAGPSASRPSIFYPTPRAKYDAWVAQSQKYRAVDIGPDEARGRYIAIAKSVGWAGEGLEEEEDDDIDFDEPDDPGSSSGGRVGGGMGTQVSAMSQVDQGEASLPLSPIHDAVVKGDVGALRKILSQDPGEVSRKDEFGNSPLHLATDRGHLEIVRALLDAGADNLALDEDDQTPLMIAQMLGRDDIAALLR